MRTLVFSDIHGNLPALEALLKREVVDNYISLGDVVNYGPWSNECVDLVCSLPCITIIGNHEDSFLARATARFRCAGIAKSFSDFCYPSFDRFDIIKGWREAYELNGFTFRHTLEGKIIYPDSVVRFDKNYVIGHSHHQSYHEHEGNRLYCIGSVGQNRHCINRIDYLIIDGNECELKNMLYDVNIILDEMRARGYPQEFIDYYNNKERALS